MSFYHLIQVLFGLALIFNAVLFVPQAIKIYRKKSAKEVSLLTFAGIAVVQVITIIHAYLVHDHMLMYGFSVAFFTCSSVVVLILRFRKTQ